LHTSLLAASCATEPETGAELEELNVSSGNGISVGATRSISPRTIEVDIATALIDARAVNGPHRVRVTLPNDYFQNPTARYPVVYLLHGGAGGNSAQWTSGGGAAEAISDGHPVIIVMPDGGKVGWFTDWVDQSGGAQKWASFYLTQLVPWVDANLRTIAAKSGRAIAGLSMGGYGAVRLAQDRPDLFGAVASLSGAVDLSDFGTRIVVTEQALQNGLPLFGPFGSPVPPADTGWKAVDPVRRAAQLAGMEVLLYAGSGIHDFDVLERTMGHSTDRLAKALAEHGVPHTFTMYGRPGPLSPFGCDGGHNFGCWNRAFSDALPRMLGVLERPAVAPGTNIVANPGLELGLASWSCIGPCGTDHGANLSHGGPGNAWVRNHAGWSDLHQTIDVTPNTSYAVTAWVRTAPNADGYFGLRTGTGVVVGEQHFNAKTSYTKLSVTVNSGPHRTLEVFAGFWANGDTWLQLDDVSVAPL
jgi:S-formylglutathione hydrolase FrmB